MLFALRASVVETFYVPSASMSPTIQPSQHLVVPKITYGVSLPFMSQRLIAWSSPRRGDVVVFRRKDDPATEADEGARAMVKRVAAVGGDTVEVAGAEVVINGEPDALRGEKGRSRGTDTDRDVGVRGRRSFRVPPDSIFLLGDNREHSFDSRYWEDPFVRVSQVVGPVVGVY
jgi:signal peptidase I